MNWIRKLFPAKNAKLTIKAAEKVFNELCTQDGLIANFYSDHPKQKKNDWRQIKTELEELMGKGDDLPELTRRIRVELAKEIELAAIGDYYMNLKAEDREIYAKWVLNSSREVQDQINYFSHPMHMAYAMILDKIVFLGWRGEEGSNGALQEAIDSYLGSCKDICVQTMLIARARSVGRGLSEEEKEDNKLTITLKEMGRKALAGEEMIDEE